MTLDDIPTLDTIQDTAMTVIEELSLPDFAVVADVASDGVAQGRSAGRRVSRVAVGSVRSHPRWFAGAVAAIVTGIVVYVLLNRSTESGPTSVVEEVRAA